MSKPSSTDSGRYPLIMDIRNVLQRTENFVAFLYLTVIFSMYEGHPISNAISSTISSLFEIS